MQEINALIRALATPGLNDLVFNGALHAQADFGDGLQQIESPFESDAELSQAMIAIALQAGARLDIARPISDFSIYGCRFHAVLAQGVSRLPLLSIRKHPVSPITLEHLVDVEMISSDQAAWLRRQLELRKTIVISGPTSSGKTTLLKAMLNELTERVIAIEQTPELSLSGAGLTLTERIANQEGAGAIELDELIVHALRMRPDRIVVGEVRSKELRVLLQAINNGHRGTLTTLHASSYSQVAERCLVLGLISSMPENLTSRLVASSVDYVVQLGRRSGKRFIEAIGKPELSAGQLVINLEDPR